MRLIQKLSSSKIAKPQNLLALVVFLAVFGTLLEISGGVWDAISHIMKEPEYFWTVQHMTVYSGVGMIASSGILGALLLVKKKAPQPQKTPIKIIIIGSVLSISAGFADSISHDIFGIDGLLSWSHQPLETGLLLSALGGYLMITKMAREKFNKILPIAIVTLILSASWLGWNLSLLIGDVILCIPFYEIFSSGCAIL